jgi:hypothetical protein
MSFTKIKDVTINGRTYAVGLVNALNGDWIVTKLGLQKYDDPDAFRKIQELLLSEVSIYRDPPNGGPPIPQKIFAAGRFLVPDLDLEYDTDTVHQICQAALEFNVGPFFERLKKERLLADGVAPSDTLQ